MRKQWGYTLVEIIVALGIFILLLGYAIINIRGASERDKVNLATDKTTTLLRRARNAGFNGVIEPYNSLYPSGGYGVYFNAGAGTVILFADRNEDGAYTVDENVEVLSLIEELTLELAGSVAINEMVIIFNEDQSPVVRQQLGSSPGSDIVATNRYVEISGETGCTGRVGLSSETGPLFVENSLTGC